MNCKQIDEIKQAFMNGEVIGEQARAVRLHLADCAKCASHLSHSEWVEIIPAIDEQIEPSSDFHRQFHARIRERQNNPAFSCQTRPFRWLRIPRFAWPQRLALAGILAALIVAGIFINRSPSESPDHPLLYGELSIAENMDLLQDMAVINNLELLENFDAIENLTSDAKALESQRSTP
jgi:anti-sigma factor RsiW